MKILAEEAGKRPTEITKRGKGSEIVKEERCLTVIASPEGAKQSRF